MANTATITLDCRQARIIAGMLRGYAELLSEMEYPAGSPPADLLLVEASQAIEMRDAMLSKLSEFGIGPAYALIKHIRQPPKPEGNSYGMSPAEYALRNVKGLRRMTDQIKSISGDQPGNNQNRLRK